MKISKKQIRKMILQEARMMKLEPAPMHSRADPAIRDAVLEQRRKQEAGEGQAEMQITRERLVQIVNEEIELARAAILSEAISRAASRSLDAAEQEVRKASPNWRTAQAHYTDASESIIGATEESNGINNRSKEEALADIADMREV